MSEESNLKEIPLTPLGIYGIMGTTMIPLSTYNLVDPSKRQEIVTEILNEFATKEIVVLGSTLIFVEGFDGFRII